MNIMMKNLSAILGLFSVAALVACSTENPIEIENDREIGDIVIGSNYTEKDLARADSIYKQENAPESSSSEVDVQSSGAGSSSSQVYPYLLENMKLRITLNSYKQVASSMSYNDPKGDPEIRFAVKYFSDGVQVRLAVTEEYTVSPILLSEKNVTEWNGSSNVFVAVTRGVDEIQLCPMVKDLDENENADRPNDVDISSGKCYAAKDVGYLKGPLKQSETTEKYKLSWTIELY